MSLAEGAQAIIAQRMKGYKPADMVIVSLCGKVKTNNPLVLADASKAYDWRWVRGLDVCLYIADAVDWPGLMKAIALCRPDNLCLWDHGGAWGATVYLPPTVDDLGKPRRFWKFELDFLPWLDCQNDDFLHCRTYERDEYGIPYPVK